MTDEMVTVGSVSKGAGGVNTEYPGSVAPGTPMGRCRLRSRSYRFPT